MGKLPKYHMLNFFYDDNGCSMTALVYGERYHVVVDSRNLQDRSKAGKRIASEYGKRLEQSKDDQVDDAEGRETASSLFVTKVEDEKSDGAKDSAVSVDSSEGDDENASSEPTAALERWMLSPLKGVFSKHSSTSKSRNVQDWYHCPNHYYDIQITDGALRAKEIDSPSSTMQKRTDTLIPSMPLPKYLRDLDLPMVSADDITVLKESDEIAPVHPAIVKHENTRYFLKVVDNSQHGPFKRELQVMKKIESTGLHKEIRVPLLRGLVHFADDEKNIMGFIMDDISSPTPLTKMLDSGIDEDKRLKWADEAAKMVDMLHQKGIIWGDAKGDNFVVDDKDELWIIDFGGSYTEGWVDPDLKETEEGDDMGVRKVCNGLKDPDENTVDPEEEAEEEADKEEVEETRALRKEVKSCRGWEENHERISKEEAGKGNKRKAKDCGDWEGNYERSSKQRKRDGKGHDGDGPKYCYCHQPESGRMLACDGENCEKQWFHFDCVGIQEAPTEKKWYCDDCNEE